MLPNSGRISPPAFSQEEYDNDESSSPELNIRTVKPGRLFIRCIRANDIRRRGFRFVSEEVNPSLNFTLLPSKMASFKKSLKPVTAASSTKNNVGSNVSFEDEIIALDIQEPTDYIRDEKDILLRIELLHNKLVGFDILGEIEVSIVRFLSPTFPLQESFPIKLSGEKIVHASIDLEFKFTPVMEGLLEVNFVECNGLPLIGSEDGPLGKIHDLMMELNLGKESMYSDSVKIMDSSASTVPVNKTMFLAVHKQNWFHDLTVKLHVIGESSSEIIETCSVPIISTFALDEESIDVHKVQAGKSSINMKFIQAGYVTFRDIRCSSFEKKSAIVTNAGLQLLFKSKGRGSIVSNKSCILRYEFPGKDIVWNDPLVLSVVDHHCLCVELYQLDALGTTQELVGSGEISLLPVYRDGTITKAVLELKRQNDVDVMIVCGEIRFTINFNGGGREFPKFHPVAMAIRADEGTVSSSSTKPKLAQEIVRKSKKNAANVAEVFTDEDILDTFQFLDLDKNRHISSRELKHVLICMGELVTDDEIDTMIDLLDTNGDGQVSFREFENMAKSPNFGHSPARVKNIDKFNQMKQVDDEYEAKRKIFSSFVHHNKIHRGIINDYRSFLRQKKNAFLSEEDNKGLSSIEQVWTTDYPSLCRCLVVECTGESRSLFDSVKPDDNAVIDVRQLLLGLVNFIPTYSVHERCQIMLELYDSEKEGFLSMEDLQKVLAGNHMKSVHSMVRKSKTIMKFVDNAGTGKLTQENLLDAASKFPNLLFPKHIGDI